MDKVEKNRKISFTAIAVSLVFLFNPNISIVDILPDFIGYIIIAVSLTNLADLNDAFFEAQKKFKFLILIDAFKLVALLWSFGMTSGNERSSSILLWTFVFAVLDFVFAIPAFIKLFSAMTELGFLYDGDYVLGAKEKNSKNNTDKIRFFTVFFLAFKAVVALLPELTELTANYYKDLKVNSSGLSLYGYVGALRFLATVVILALGAVWLVRVIRYFLNVNRDTVFMDSLNNAYNERILPKMGLFVKRRLNIAGYLLISAAVVTVDIRFDGVNLIPDIFVIPLIAVAFMLLGKTVKISKKATLTVCVLSALTALAHTVAEYIFLAKFYDKSIEIIWRSEDAMLWYSLTVGLAVASAVCTVLLFGWIFKAYRSVIATVTEAEIIDGRNADFLRGYAEDNKKSLEKRLIVCFIIFCVYIATDICYAVFSKAFAPMFLVNTVGAIAFVIATISFTSALSGAVRDKYKFE